MPDPLPFMWDDGGRADAGYKGDTRDCAARSLSIVTGQGYAATYDQIIEWAKTERPRGTKKRSHPRTGVFDTLLRRMLPTIGLEWVPTMEIGVGTVVHLRRGELPDGKLLVSCSRHYTAVIDQVVHDTYDPTRDGTRAVYGYYRLVRG